MSRTDKKEVGGKSMKGPDTADKPESEKAESEQSGRTASSARPDDEISTSGAQGGANTPGKGGDDKTGGKASREAKTAKKTNASKEVNASKEANASCEDTADNGPDPVAALQEELATERDRYLRLAAEYDNYRKRSAKERELMYSDARTDTITRLLPVYDNLERALKMECSDEPFYKGIEMTVTQLIEILESMGVKQIPAAGEPFDPNLHNAVLTIENPELGEKIIAEECQKGFMLGDRVIRHSTVVVAN